jgi:hypothetical protein
MKITQIRDQLVVVGEKVEDAKLVNMALNGFPASWVPNFERLWDDYIQKETRMDSKAGKKDGEENLALFDQSNKGKGKGPSKGKGKSREPTSQPKKYNLSEIKCFSFHKHAHYASQCPDKKKGKRK